MKHPALQWLRRISPLQAAAKSVAVLLAYLVGVYITGHFHQESALTGALLACTSVIVIIEQQDTRHSLEQAWLRILGSLIGAVIACLYLFMFPFSLPGMVISIFVLEITCMVLKIPNNSKMSVITLIAILITSQKSPDLPPLKNGLLRFTESAMGAVIGMGMALLQDFYKKHKAAKEESGKEP